MFSTTGSGVADIETRWQAGGERASCLVAQRDVAPIEARQADMPADLHERLRAALATRGVHGLYIHQARAWELARAGRDFLVATPTASGKTLCFNLPVFDALLADPRATALYVFPTKALARDQVAEAEALAAASGAAAPIAVYDGDTPPDVRRAARARARVIATNPDMLHAAILPHHARFARFFAGLRYVVIDEVHAYRGVFGAHLANVLRRLMRVTRFHGADPRFIGATATIGNPGEHAARLFSRPVEVVANNGAPSGPRTLWVMNPPLVDRTLGARANAIDAAVRLVRDLWEGGASTIAFVRTRTQVEVLVRALREAGVRDVRGYRSGYLPGRRREVERDLRAGRARTVVATSALELGIDIGSLDAAVVVGWPGSRAALWQRFGRAGRRGAPSLGVLIARGDPTDQFVAAESGWLFDDGVESARTAPDNPAIVLAHLACAAFELPFADGETGARPPDRVPGGGGRLPGDGSGGGGGGGGCPPERVSGGCPPERVSGGCPPERVPGGFGPLDPGALREALGLMEREGRVARADDGWQWIGQVYPAAEVPLRGEIEENFLVVDEERGTVLAEVDRRDAPRLLHDGAIHGVEGQLHEVRRLDWAGRKCYVRRVEADYYTTAIGYTKVRPLRIEEEGGRAAWGEAHVAERVIGFKKIRLGTHENVGYGEVKLPDCEMHTTACWFDPVGHGLLGPDVGEGAEGAAYALRHAAALLLMSDAADLGLAVDAVTGMGEPATAGPAARAATVGCATSGQPRIYLFDRVAGGSGLADGLFARRVEAVERARAAVLRCGCSRGCPGCVGPGRRKDLARAILTCLAAN